MRFTRNLIKDSRILVLASASGVALLSTHLPSFAVDRGPQQPGLVQTEPGRLQVSSANVRSISSANAGQTTQVQYQQPSGGAQSRVQQLYGNQASPPPQIQPAPARPIAPAQPQTSAAPQRAQYQQQQSQPQQRQVSQTAGSRIPKRSLFDRLVGKLRGDTSNPPPGPPQDPGMRYPTASDAARRASASPQVVRQPVNRFVPPAATTSQQPSQDFVVPPAPGASATADVSQPRLFPVTPEKPNPVVPNVARQEQNSPTPSRFIPPMPGSDEFVTLTPSASVDDRVANSPVESYPELKAIMQGTPEQAPAPAALNPQEVLVPPAVDAVAEHPISSPTPEETLPANERKLPMLEEVVESNNKVEASQPELSVPELATIPPMNAAIIPPAPDTLLEETPAVITPAPTRQAPTQTALADPLANPFPDDVKASPSAGEESLDIEWKKSSKTAGTTAEPKELAVVTEPQIETGVSVPEPSAEKTDSENEEDTKPYTGLALEEDLFLNMQEPALAEPVEADIAETATAEPEEIASLESGAALPPKLPALPTPKVDSEPESEQQLTPSKEAPKLQAPKEEPELARTDEKPEASEEMPQVKDSRQSKMEMIAARKELPGLKGFCPVILRDRRDLVDSQGEFQAVFNGKEYQFSSEEALEKFINEPGKYAPAARGSDVIHLSLTGEEVEGSLDHAVWYKGRLYLFTSVETLETFVAAPSSHSTNL